MPAFVYSPLPEGHIRLLEITPNPDEFAPSHCRLFDYPLHQGTRKGSHLYEALSYVWGSSERPRVVGTDDGTIPVTQNLHAALSRLRDGYIPRVVAANRDPDETVSHTDHDISKEVLSVLNHQWFRRVWVLKRSPLPAKSS